ncbi:hypothetical protein K4F52_009328 [Lecanicillium sp. MT-2017a]|nr:hypothetical protein K4F52_009328 [Lecanicillium sp. MT-2017a]
MITLPQCHDNIKDYVTDLSNFISTPLVRQITGGIHVNDALIYKAWEALPPEWTDWWLTLPDHRLAQQDLITNIEEIDESRCNGSNSVAQAAQNRPPSLTQWLQTLSSLALPRLQRSGPKISLPDVLLSRMKTKKTAEISKAVAHIHDVCQRKGITRIVDMGSGQGYLSISLAYLFPSLEVLSIDGSESQVTGAKAFVASLGIPETRVKHLVRWIDGSPALSEEITVWAEGDQCMLVGLHACGNLSEHMLRYFTTTPCITELAVVGCCYNHIIPRSADCPEGFPISNALQEKTVTLSATALMTGCQAPYNWAKPDLESGTAEQSPFAKRRLYRAILEKLFYDKGIKLDTDERPAWGIRKGDMANFTSFARRAMDYLGVNADSISDSELEAYDTRYRDFESQIAILWTLSVLCCKVVESVVALDRYLFLTEQGARNIDVVPIFDIKVSPRNLMITASKAD